MFHNTVGGTYQEISKTKVIYTFPQDASVNIGGVSIPIGGMRVECFGGKLDYVTSQHFTSMTSLINSNNHEIINSSIYIVDAYLDMQEFTIFPRKDFLKYGVEFITLPEFVALQRRINSRKDHPEYPRLREIVEFKTKMVNDERKKFVTAIENILRKDEHFPKYISLIYNDTSGHLAHVVMKFKNPTQFKLLINNTFPLLFALIPQDIWKEFPIDAYTCQEAIIGENSSKITLSENKEGKEITFELEMGAPIKHCLLFEKYKKMVDLFHSIDSFRINGVDDIEFMPTTWNQKDTDECVPFAIENKIAYAKGEQPLTSETARNMGVRLRAQHAILSYLLTGMDHIPHFDVQERKDCDFSYDYENEWYPNFSEICAQLDGAIQNLSLEDLRKLYLSMEIDGVDKLANKFRKLISEAILKKSGDDEYVSIPMEHLSHLITTFRHPSCVPEILSDENKSEMLISKSWINNNAQNISASLNSDYSQLADLVSSLKLTV